MPCHIYFRLGQFARALEQDRRAVAVSQAQCVLTWALQQSEAALTDPSLLAGLPSPLTMSALLESGQFGSLAQLPSLSPASLRLAVSLCDADNRLHSYEWGTHSALQVGLWAPAIAFARSNAFINDLAQASLIVSAMPAIMNVTANDPQGDVIRVADLSQCTGAMVYEPTAATARQIRGVMHHLHRVAGRMVLESMLWHLGAPRLLWSSSAATTTSPSPPDLAQWAAFTGRWFRDALAQPQAEEAWSDAVAPREPAARRIASKFPSAST